MFSRFFSHRTTGLSSQAKTRASTKGISRDTSGTATNTVSSTAPITSAVRIPSRSQSCPRWGQVSRSGFILGTTSFVKGGLHAQHTIWANRATMGRVTMDSRVDKVTNCAADAVSWPNI